MAAFSKRKLNLQSLVNAPTGQAQRMIDEPTLTAGLLGTPDGPPGLAQRFTGDIFPDVDMGIGPPGPAQPLTGPAQRFTGDIFPDVDFGNGPPGPAQRQSNILQPQTAALGSNFEPSFTVQVEPQNQSRVLQPNTTRSDGVAPALTSPQLSQALTAAPSSGWMPESEIRAAMSSGRINAAEGQNMMLAAAGQPHNAERVASARLKLGLTGAVPPPATTTPPSAPTGPLSIRVRQRNGEWTTATTTENISRDEYIRRLQSAGLEVEGMGPTQTVLQPNTTRSDGGVVPPPTQTVNVQPRVLQPNTTRSDGVVPASTFTGIGPSGDAPNTPDSILRWSGISGLMGRSLIPDMTPHPTDTNLVWNAAGLRWIPKLVDQTGTGGDRTGGGTAGGDGDGPPDTTTGDGNTGGTGGAGTGGTGSGAITGDMKSRDVLIDLLNRALTQGQAGTDALGGIRGDLKTFLATTWSGMEQNFGKQRELVDQLLGKATGGLDTFIANMNQREGLSPEALTALNNRAVEGTQRQYQGQVEDLKSQLLRRGAAGGMTPAALDAMISGYGPLMASRDQSRSEQLNDITLENERIGIESLDRNRALAMQALGQYGGLTSAVGNIFDPSNFMAGAGNTLGQILGADTAGLNNTLQSLGLAGNLGQTLLENEPESLKSILLGGLLGLTPELLKLLDIGKKDTPPPTTQTSSNGDPWWVVLAKSGIPQDVIDILRGGSSGDPNQAARTIGPPFVQGGEWSGWENE